MLTDEFIKLPKEEVNTQKYPWFTNRIEKNRDRAEITELQCYKIKFLFSNI